MCSYTSITFVIFCRIEEIPRDELNLADDEMLIPVAHFYKDVFSAFGIPFLIKVKQVSIISKHEQ
jgi:ubiquitin carboxyl-terminal hydrolase 7